MYNDILKIGPVTVHGYGLMIAIGLIIGMLVGERRAKKRGLNPDEIDNLTFLCAILGFVCGKILFCIVEWRAFFQNPWSVLGTNGFVVYGGIMGGILVAYLWCCKRKLPFWEYFDVVLPSVALVQGFGRIGCFLAGCCYGRETDAWYGIAFTHSDFAPNDVKLIPTQLISSAGLFLIAGILIWYARKPRKVGVTGAWYLILYSIGRFLVEFLRDDDRGAVGGLSTSQFISVFMLIAGIIVLMRSLKGEKMTPFEEYRDENEERD